MSGMSFKLSKYGNISLGLPSKMEVLVWKPRPDLLFRAILLSLLCALVSVCLQREVSPQHQKQKETRNFRESGTLFVETGRGDSRLSGLLSPRKYINCHNAKPEDLYLFW